MAAPQTWKEYFASWNNMCAPAGGGIPSSSSAPSGEEAAKPAAVAAAPVSVGAAPVPTKAADPDQPQTWGAWLSSWNNMCAAGGGAASAPSS